MTRLLDIYWFTVNGRAEETDCAWCATPLLNGDRAICDEAWAEEFCSPPCLQRDRNHLRSGETLEEEADRLTDCEP